MSAVVILISGRGSNLQAILKAVERGELDVRIAAVISNNPSAPGLAIAARAGVTTQVIDHRLYAARELFDRALIQAIDAHRPDLVVLAGFMRILGTELIEHYRGRLMNIHPSLLPEFKGLNTHARALAAGVTRHGASVHFVTPEVDGGPIIVQAPVAVHTKDSVETLAARVLEQEHRILPQAIAWFAADRLRIDAGQVLLDDRPVAEQGLLVHDRAAGSR